jgi:acyl dehydratase
MPVREVESIDELKEWIGREVSVSDWVEITQDQVNTFADATHDHQWIHIDVERAKKESPFGGPIAHGYLTLSMFPYLISKAFKLNQKFKMGVNYGINKLRFMSPVPAGGKIRARMELINVSEVKGGYQVEGKVTVDIEGQDKPACVAEPVYRYYN